MSVIVNEGLTTSRRITDLFPYRDRYGFHGLASGGIGWSLPASVGIAMAQKGRPVVTYVGDGSAMYSIQAIWTTAHHKLPITYVHLQQRRLSHHQAAPEGVPPERSFHRHGLRASRAWTSSALASSHGHEGAAHHRA